MNIKYSSVYLAISTDIACNNSFSQRFFFFDFYKAQTNMILFNKSFIRTRIEFGRKKSNSIESNGRLIDIIKDHESTHIHSYAHLHTDTCLAPQNLLYSCIL